MTLEYDNDNSVLTDEISGKLLLGDKTIDEIVAEQEQYNNDKINEDG